LNPGLTRTYGAMRTCFFLFVLGGALGARAHRRPALSLLGFFGFAACIVYMNFGIGGRLEEARPLSAD